MKLFLAVLFLSILFAARAAAQESGCKSMSAPRLFNLSLGMSAEQTQSVLGKDLKIKIKKNGQSTFFQNFIEKPPPSSLSGVRALYLRFFDRRLYQIEIFYEQRSDAGTLADFAGYLSVVINLPVSTWQIYRGKAVIKCGEFSLVADKILNPRVEITDETVRSKVEELRKQKN